MGTRIAVAAVSISVSGGFPRDATPGSLLCSQAALQAPRLRTDGNRFDGAWHRSHRRRLQRSLWRPDRPIPLSRRRSGLPSSPSIPSRVAAKFRSPSPNSTSSASQIRRGRPCAERREHGRHRRRDSAVGQGARNLRQRLSGSRRAATHGPVLHRLRSARGRRTSSRRGHQLPVLEIALRFRSQTCSAKRSSSISTSTP